MVNAISGISGYSGGNSTNVYEKFRSKYAACPADYGSGPYIQPIAQPIVPIYQQPKPKGIIEKIKYFFK